MQLKLFDILSSVIPGALVLYFLFLTGFYTQINVDFIEKKIGIYKDISVVITTVFIVVSFLTGYIIHAVGSWIEPVVWKTWGGRPTQILFSNDDKRLGLGSEQVAIFNWLKSKSTNTRLQALEINQFHANDYRQLFQIAKNLAFANAGANFKSRIEEFNNGYIFSRNIFVSTLIILGCVFYLFLKFSISFWWVFLIIIIVLIVWWRARDRAIYYSREILVSGYYSTRSSEK